MMKKVLLHGSSISLLAALIFLVDLTTELGFAVGAFYITIILLAHYPGPGRLPLIFAVICSILVVLGYFFSPSSGEPWKAVANRLISLYAVWTIAIFSWYRGKSEQKRLALIGELESANTKLKGFSSVVSHDLKNPLMVIEGLVNRLRRKHAGRLDDKGLELLQGIKDNCDNANRLINDFLAFSRAGTAELQKQHIDMTGLAKKVYAELAPSSGDRDIRFHCPDLPAAFGDPTMLRQVLTNLIANAIKFTRERETAVIELGGSMKKKENVYYVRDNGAGFDMQSADRLFLFFERLHDARRFEGTGVGLVIVKTIIEKHGGRVWAEGKPDQGAAFYFTLPRGKALPEK